MLLTVSEAAVGGFYLTAKSSLRCEYRGPAPKKTPTSPPMYRLYMSGGAAEIGRGGSEIIVPGDYMLATLDAESPAFGAVTVDAFALHSVAWARDRVHLLSDDDIELLAETDRRPGVQSACASEVIRRREAAKAPTIMVAPPEVPGFQELDVIPEPAASPVQVLALASAEDGERAHADGIISAATLAEVRRAFSPGEPLTPPDDGIAAAFPDAVPDDVDARMEEAVQVIVGAFDEAVDRAIAATSPEPSPTAREADDIPWPPPEEVRAKAPAPDDELIAAKAEAEDALGPDFLRMTRAEPPADPWVISVATPTGPSAGSSRLFGGPTPADAIAAAKSWLATMREPVTPPPRRNRRQTPTSDDSAKIAALESEIAELKAERAEVAAILAAAIPGEPSTLTERARKALDLLVSAPERERAAAAREEQLAAEVVKLRAEATELTAENTSLLAEAVRDEAALLAAREQREEDITGLARAALDLAAAKKEIAQIKATAPSDALPPSLSEAGKLRATQGRAALRVLAETFPATVAIEEAQALLSSIRGADSA